MSPRNGVEPVKVPLIREQDFGVLEGQPVRRRGGRASQDSSACMKDQSCSQQPERQKLDNAQKTGDVEISEFPATQTGKLNIFDHRSEVESVASMVARVEIFLDKHIMPVIQQYRGNGLMSELKAHWEDPTNIAIVAHGVILSVLFKRLLARASEVTASELAHKRGFKPGKGIPWENTAYTVIKFSATAVKREEKDSSAKYENLAAYVETVNERRHLEGVKRTLGGIGSSEDDTKQRRLEEFFKRRPQSLPSSNNATDI